jgi:hypothetical protein
MATLSYKKLSGIRARLQEGYPDEEVDNIMSIIGQFIDLEKHNEKLRERQRQYTAAQKEQTGSTYSIVNRRYYEKNKERLNAQRADAYREKRTPAAEL